MSELEYERDPEQDAPTDGPSVVELPDEAGTARLALPADADPDEVAALVAAVAARLGESAAGDDPDVERTDPWRLAARLGVRRRVELPRECRRGGEWKAAGRRP